MAGSCVLLEDFDYDVSRIYVNGRRLYLLRVCGGIVEVTGGKEKIGLVWFITVYAGGGAAGAMAGFLCQST